MFRHAKCTNLLLAKDGLHLCVGSEKLFVLRILQLLLRILSTPKRFVDTA